MDSHSFKLPVRGTSFEVDDRAMAEFIPSYWELDFTML